MVPQRTIRRTVSCTGIGLHKGVQTKLELSPAPPNTGIQFIRSDRQRHATVRAHIDCLRDTALATTLGAGVNGSAVIVSTVEHLLAAAAGLGVDNLIAKVDGPELPILDGSAAPFVKMLREAGVVRQASPRAVLVIKQEVRVGGPQKYARLRPCDGFRVRCRIDFQHPLIARDVFLYELSEDTFCRELAPARTFGFLRDVEALRARGLAKGGNLDNVVVLDGDRALNPEGLRFRDEFVRHKVLDAVGDMALLGMPVIGELDLLRSGHDLNTQLVRAVLSDPSTYDIMVQRAPAVEPYALAASV